MNCWPFKSRRRTQNVTTASPSTSHQVNAVYTNPAIPYNNGGGGGGGGGSRGSSSGGGGGGGNGGNSGNNHSAAGVDAKVSELTERNEKLERVANRARDQLIVSSKLMLFISVVEIFYFYYLLDRLSIAEVLLNL